MPSLADKLQLRKQQTTATEAAIVTATEAAETATKVLEAVLVKQKEQQDQLTLIHCNQLRKQIFLKQTLQQHKQTQQQQEQQEQQECHERLHEKQKQPAEQQQQFKGRQNKLQHVNYFFAEKQQQNKCMHLNIKAQQQQLKQQQTYKNTKNRKPKKCFHFNASTAFISLGPIFTLMISILSYQALETSAAIVPPQTDQNFEIPQQHQQTQKQQQQQQQIVAQSSLLFNNNKLKNSSNNNNNYSNRNNNQQHLTTLVAPLQAANHTFKSLSIIDGSRAETETETNPQYTQQQQPPDPQFDYGLLRNITIRTGQAEAIIICRVDMLNDKSVSWIRKRDLHILTVDSATYTSDQRFKVTTSQDLREWMLHIKSPQQRDSGIYECQVNTEPKKSMAFQLNVIHISPNVRAVISGPADLHFKVGSAIILNCIVNQPSVKDVSRIFWFRGDRMITPVETDDDNDNSQHNYDGYNGYDQQNNNIHRDFGGYRHSIGAQHNTNANADDADDKAHELTNEITLDFAQRIAIESHMSDTLKSRLRISNAQTTDTGNYTCLPTTACSASVMVHVINDENPAAMQKGAAVGLYGFSAQQATLMVAIVYYCRTLANNFIVGVDVAVAAAAAAAAATIANLAVNVPTGKTVALLTVPATGGHDIFTRIVELVSSWYCDCDVVVALALLHTLILIIIFLVKAKAISIASEFLHSVDASVISR